MVLAIQEKRSDGIGRGALLVIAAIACFTVIDVCARWLTREAGFDAIQVAFVRYAGHLTMVLALVLPVHGRGLFATRSPMLESARGIFLLGSTILNFTAVTYLPLSLTASIMFATPLMVCALSMPLLGERVGRKRWTAILIGFVGVVLITRPWSADLHWAVFVSLASVFCASLYFVLTRKLAGVDATDTQQFYASLVATAALAPFALADWMWPSRPIDWLPFLAIGFFGWAGHQLVTIAYRSAPAASLSPYFYFQLVFLTAADFLVFAVAPDPWIVPGLLIVVGSGLFIWLRERALEAEARR